DHGITNVAVLDKGYIGGGNTGRNTAIIRSNYLTPEGVKFYDESVTLYKDLANDFDMNIMYSERGHYTLAHTDSAIRTMRWRAEVNKHFGIESELVLRDELMRMVPQLNYSDEVRYPIMGALYHAPGAIARHDAVAWGYAAGAAMRSVHIHQNTEVHGFEITKANGSGQRVTGVKTNRGTIKAGKVIQCVAGMSGVVSDMAGFKLPLKTIPLQACVSQPQKPFLDAIVVSGSLHVYVSQSSRGELVMGGSTDPYGVYMTRSSLDFKEGLMMHMLELLPFIGEVKLLRQWAGMTDMTPDFAPIMGETPIDNYYVDAGWGTWGFKATPVCGKRNAEMLATGKVPDTIAPFALQRFHDFKLVGEKGAASVGH
ncbi:MAG: FAD-dependent oxidoreductase, partial [Rhodospirillaceae bacterium]|nr:FAD-dependent oxidoreductase [Rhodospirillaceae bacterium]